MFFTMSLKFLAFLKVIIPDIDIKKPNFSTSFANSSVAVKQCIKPVNGFFLYSLFNIEMVSKSASLVCIIIGNLELLDILM